MKNGYKMSMIKKDGRKDYYGEFETKDSAIRLAEKFLEIDSNYVDYKIWYFEK